MGIFNKIRLNYLLKNDSSKNNVVVYFNPDMNEVLFVKKSKRDIGYSVFLNELDFISMTTYFSDGEYIVYEGVPDNMINFVLLILRKKFDIEIFEVDRCLFL